MFERRLALISTDGSGSNPRRVTVGSFWVFCEEARESSRPPLSKRSIASFLEHHGLAIRAYVDALFSAKKELTEKESGWMICEVIEQSIVWTAPVFIGDAPPPVARLQLRMELAPVLLFEGGKLKPHPMLPDTVLDTALYL
ncbi:MAG: hypothetical protein Q7R83_02735 [bacterium]|nr:hypothetical protein [bacterium]